MFYTNEKKFTDDVCENRRIGRILVSDPHERDKNITLNFKSLLKLVFACVASDGKKILLIVFEEDERLTGDRYV